MTDHVRAEFEQLLAEMRPKLHRYCARMTGQGEPRNARLLRCPYFRRRTRRSDTRLPVRALRNGGPRPAARERGTRLR